MDYNHQIFKELMPSLPEEIALECLTRLHYSSHRVSSRVCRTWCHLLQSKDFYYHRKQSGFTQKSACFIQALPVESESKSAAQPRYGMSLFDPITRIWDRINPIPKYPDGMPLFSQVASSEGKLVVMGGWNPSTWDPVKDVFVYEFTTRKWTQCVDMPSTRSFFAIGAVGSKVIVAGGHDECKNALNTSWIFDINKNEWSQLSTMNEERDECEGVVVGSKFWVVSGYGTETQGVFKSSAEVFDFESMEWTRVEDAWRMSRCPRSCVGFRNGLICWAELDSSVQVGACGVELGDGWIVVTGSEYQGGPHGFFLLDKKQGQNGKLVKINDIPTEFSGLVQSGCYIEI